MHFFQSEYLQAETVVIESLDLAAAGMDSLIRWGSFVAAPPAKGRITTN
jgi:hypothetical protein